VWRGWDFAKGEGESRFCVVSIMGRSIWTGKGPDKDEIILVCSLVDLEQNKNERLFKVTFASALFAYLALSGTVTPVTVRVRLRTASAWAVVPAGW